MTPSEWLACIDPAKMLKYLQSSGYASDRKLRLFASLCCQRIWHLLLDDRGKLLLPTKWQGGRPDAFAQALRQLWDNRTHVVKTMEDYVKTQEEFADGIVSQRDLADRATALAEIAWSDAEALADCIADLNEGVSAAEALRTCAILFSSAASSDSTPRDVITYAGAAVLFAGADAYADVAKDVEEGHARYAGQVEDDAQAARCTQDLGLAGEVLLGAPVTPARQAAMDASRAIALAVGQVSRAAGGAERQAQSDLLREIFGPMPFRHLSGAGAWSVSRVVALARTIYDNRAFDALPKLALTLEEAGCTDAEIIDHCRQEGSHVRGCWVVDFLLGRK
jgi:hypothetical protein